MDFNSNIMTNKIKELKQQLSLERENYIEFFGTQLEQDNIASSKYWLGKKTAIEEVIVKLDLIISEYSHEN